MSNFVLKYMVNGNVNVNEFNTVEHLLPVMAHVQDKHYPYYIMQDGKAIFKYNLQYVEKQAKPAEVYTLRIKYPDETKSEDYTDLVSLAAATMAANDAGFPWYVVDGNGKIVRKGNLENLNKQISTPKPQSVISMDDIEADIDAMAEDAINALNDYGL